MAEQAGTIAICMMLSEHAVANASCVTCINNSNPVGDSVVDTLIVELDQTDNQDMPIARTHEATITSFSALKWSTRCLRSSSPSRRSYTATGPGVNLFRVHSAPSPAGMTRS